MIPILDKKITCTRCNKSGHVRKHGLCRGKQRYFCVQCKKPIPINFANHVISDEEASNIVEYWINGYENLSQVARRFNTTRYYVKKLILDRYGHLYSQSLETKRQVLKHDIIEDEVNMPHSVVFSALKKQLRKDVIISRQSIHQYDIGFRRID